MKGIVYLTNVGMKNDGKMASNFTANSWPYEHGIATYALGEALTFCKELKVDIPGLVEVTEKAGQFIIDNQNNNGGWAYLYATSGGHTDTSVVGWQIQALHSAKLCKDLKVDPKVLQKAMKFLDTVASGSSKYKYGYNSPATFRPSLTSVGLLCRYYLNGWGPNHPAMRDGAEYLLKMHKPSNEAEFDMYY